MKPVNFFFLSNACKILVLFLLYSFLHFGNYYKELEYVRVHVVLTKTVVDSNLRFSVC